MHFLKVYLPLSFERLGFARFAGWKVQHSNQVRTLVFAIRDHNNRHRHRTSRAPTSTCVPSSP